MAISNMAFSPTTGLNDATYSPTNPASEAAIRSQIQGISDQLRDYINNTLNPYHASTYETIADLTTNRKLSSTGDFTGTLMGLPITATDPGLSSIVTNHISDDVHIGLNQSVKVYNNSNQNIANITYVPINFDAEFFDTHAQHDNVTNNTRLTCKDSGKYLMIGNISFASNSTGIRIGRFKINGSLTDGVVATNAVNGFTTVLNVVMVRNLSLNDYIELEVYQSSGAGLDVNGASATSFSMVKIG